MKRMMLILFTLLIVGTPLQAEGVGFVVKATEINGNVVTIRTKGGGAKVVRLEVVNDNIIRVSGFTEDGLYNAAALFVYASDSLYQKFCFEQDERGNHRVVTVRTVGTSDDNNHEVFNDAKFIWYKISSDARTIASYYSLDGQQWQLVRLYKNAYPDTLYLGICSQAPQSDECVSVFDQLLLTTDNVCDFRMGE